MTDLLEALVEEEVALVVEEEMRDDSEVEATLEVLSLEVALVVTSMGLVVDVVDQVVVVVVAEEWVVEVDFATMAVVEEVVVTWG